MIRSASYCLRLWEFFCVFVLQVLVLQVLVLQVLVLQVLAF